MTQKIQPAYVQGSYLSNCQILLNTMLTNINFTWDSNTLLSNLYVVNFNNQPSYKYISS